MNLNLTATTVFPPPTRTGVGRLAHVIATIDFVPRMQTQQPARVSQLGCAIEAVGDGRLALRRLY